jgi:NTE family protein
MATDMETGSSVILDKGNLAEAILISNTLPTLFQPVAYNGKLLMDGGISNNYPIEHLLTKDLEFTFKRSNKINFRYIYSN